MAIRIYRMMRAPSLEEWRLLGPPTVLLLACSVIFLLASGRGFDFRDDADYLLWVVNVDSYKATVTEFAFIWRPLYLLVGGDIGLYRIGGLVVLCCCGLTFASGIMRFVGPRADAFVVRSFIRIALLTALFWEFMLWEPTPNYNELNLCALLLFFAGLLFASRDLADSPQKASLLEATIAPSVLTGLSFAIMALGKPTTCLLTFVLALSWIVLVRPPRPILCFCVAAITACIALTVAIFVIDGSFAAFAYLKFSALKFDFAQNDGKDVHGIWNSIVGPFLPERRWKIVPAALFGFVILAICASIYALEILPNRLDRRYRQALSIGLLLLLGGLVALWRTLDIGGPVVPAYHAWHFALLLALLALIMVVFAKGLVDTNGVGERRGLAAAAILALAPISYSFGTNNPVVLHMTTAGVFWIGAAVLVAMLLSANLTLSALRVISLSVGTATLGFLIGVMASPGPIGNPIWQQVVPITLGPQNAVLRVDAPTAEYLAAMRRAAVANGFVSDTPIIDLSGVGPGLIFLLNGRASGVPWLANNSADTRAFSTAVLQTVSHAELDRSWVLTAPEVNIEMYGTLLRSIGLNFPDGYIKVAQVRRSDLGWSQALWRPRTTPRP